MALVDSRQRLIAGQSDGFALEQRAAGNRQGDVAVG